MGSLGIRQHLGCQQPILNVYAFGRQPGMITSSGVGKVLDVSPRMVTVFGVGLRNTTPLYLGCVGGPF